MNDLERITGIITTTVNAKNLKVDLTDLGTVHSAEMYSNSNKKQKQNRKQNTFQQSTPLAGFTNENVCAASPPNLPSPAAQAVVGEPEVIQENQYGRRINWQNDLLVRMQVQIGKIRVGDRNHRCTTYISIQTDTDKRFMIFMRGDLTTANYETLASINKDCDKDCKRYFDHIMEEQGNNNVFTGRIKYKVTKGQKIQKWHRKNLPRALFAVWENDNIFYARFYLLDNIYDFILDEPITKKQQEYYDLQGSWILDEGTLTMEDAYGY